MSNSNKVIVENMVYRGQGKPCRSCFFIRGLQGLKVFICISYIEIRKPWKNEILTQKICVGNHEYNY